MKKSNTETRSTSTPLIARSTQTILVLACSLMSVLTISTTQAARPAVLDAILEDQVAASQPAQAPGILPAPGSYQEYVLVSFDHIDKGDKVFYTTSAELTSSSGQVYSSPLLLTENTQLSYFVLKSTGAISPIKTSYFQITHKSPTQGPWIIDATPSSFFTASIVNGRYTNLAKSSIRGIIRMIFEESTYATLKHSVSQTHTSVTGPYSYIFTSFSLPESYEKNNIRLAGTIREKTTSLALFLNGSYIGSLTKDVHIIKPSTATIHDGYNELTGILINTKGQTRSIESLSIAF